MSNICAGIGRGQMEVLNERVEQRRANHQFYQNLFTDIKMLSLHTEPDSDYFSNHWLSIALFSPEHQVKRAELIKKFKEKKIETRPIWKPLHLQPVFNDAVYFGSDLSEKLFMNGLCLPSGSNLTHQNKDRIKAAFYHVLK